MSDDPFEGENQDVVGPDPEEQARLVAARAAYDKMVDAGLKKLMGDVECRAWVWSLLHFCHVGKTSWRSDGMLMARLEGERNVGLRILADVFRVAEDEYLKMAREGKILG